LINWQTALDIECNLEKLRLSVSVRTEQFKKTVEIFSNGSNNIHDYWNKARANCYTKKDGASGDFANWRGMQVPPRPPRRVLDLNACAEK
jgi:hypothetical protein